MILELSDFDKQNIPAILLNEKEQYNWLSAYILRFMYYMNRPMTTLAKYFPTHADAIAFYFLSISKENRVHSKPWSAEVEREDLWYLFWKAAEPYRSQIGAAFPEEFTEWQIFNGIQNTLQ